VIWARSCRLGISTPPAHGLRFLDLVPIAPARGQTGLVASPSPPSCQRTFGESWASYVDDGWMSSAASAKVRRPSFHDGVEVKAARENNAPAMATDLSLEVVSSPVVSCFFGVISFWRAF